MRITAQDIRNARSKLQLNQSDFAKRLGTTQQHVSKWELGTPPRKAWQSILGNFLKRRGLKNC